jgi:UV DNA damage endonuclease
MIILGYPGYNTELRELGVLVNRTCREATGMEKGIKYMEDLFFKNLSDIFKTLQWNAEHNIKFYRMSSDIAPHCTNPNFLAEKDRQDFNKLVYSLEPYKKYLKKIGKFAKNNGIRVTFHPDLFTILNSQNNDIVIKSFRDLHFHAILLDYMELDNNSVVILHGGGVYGDKNAAIKNWVKNFNKLPDYIKKRVVIENDEYSYSTEDVLLISSMVKPYEIISPKTGKKIMSTLPVVFDVFHYYCYNIMLAKKRAELDAPSIALQPTMPELLPKIKKTWDTSERNIKMHISEQDPELSFGAHAAFVNVIPKELFDFANELEKEEKDLYLMIESKSKEQSLLFLQEKYFK